MRTFGLDSKAWFHIGKILIDKHETLIMIAVNNIQDRIFHSNFTRIIKIEI